MRQWLKSLGIVCAYMPSSECLLVTVSNEKRQNIVNNGYFQRELVELSRWTERVRSCEPVFITSNRLFAVTCSYFHHSILPELDYICQRTSEFVTTQCVTEAQQFISELQHLIQVL